VIVATPKTPAQQADTKRRFALDDAENKAARDVPELGAENEPGAVGK